MATTIESLLEPIRKSPLLPELAEKLIREVNEERSKREKFYAEMTPSQKTEFIGGEVVMHSPARNVHLDVTKWISNLLDAHISSSKLGQLKIEKCLVVFPRNDYEPDLVFFSNESAAAFTKTTLKFPVPDFVVEVLSSSTQARDRGVKFEDYAAHGVGEYWIVDAERGVVEQYLLNPDGNYELELKTGTGEIRSRVVEGFVAPVGAFFDPEENLSFLRKLLA